MLIYNDKGELRKVTDIISVNNFEDPFYEESILNRFTGKLLTNGRCYNDTFNILNKYQRINYCDMSDTLPVSVPTEGTAKDFATIVDETTLRLHKEHGHLTLLWSGGLDSTTILCSFIRNLPKQDYTVLFANGSIQEAPKFYAYISTLGLDLLNLEEQSIYKYLDTCNVESHYILGLPEVQYGYSKMMECCRPFWFHHWKEGLFEGFSQKGVSYTEKEREELIGYFEEYTRVLNLHVIHTVDLLWVYLYSALYTYLTSHFTSEVTPTARFRYNVSLFFRTHDFTRWAFQHNLYHTQEVFDARYSSRCRQPERDYILTIFNDPEVLVKEKVHSQIREARKKPLRDTTITHKDGVVVIPMGQTLDFIKELISK